MFFKFLLTVNLVVFGSFAMADSEPVPACPAIAIDDSVFVSGFFNSPDGKMIIQNRPLAGVELKRIFMEKECFAAVLTLFFVDGTDLPVLLTYDLVATYRENKINVHVIPMRGLPR